MIVSKIKLFLFLLISFYSCGIRSQNLILNGGFEDQIVSKPIHCFPSINPNGISHWVVVGLNFNCDVALFPKGTGLGIYKGNNSIDLQNHSNDVPGNPLCANLYTTGGSIQQSITTVKNQTYRCSFASITNGNQNEYILVYLNSNLVFKGSGDPAAYTLSSFTFVGSGIDVLRFTNNQSTGAVTAIDDISVVAECTTIKNNQNHTICQGSFISIANNVYSMPGVYEVLDKTVNGCDSINIIDIKLGDSIKVNLSYEIFSDSSINIGGEIFDQEGVYEIKNKSVLGCDSITYLNIKVIPKPKDNSTLDLKKYIVSNVVKLNGSNSRIMISNYKSIKNIWFLKIYDRWGNLVQNSNKIEDLENGILWDAKLNDSILTEGVFTYIINFVDENDKSVFISGTITLIN